MKSPDLLVLGGGVIGLACAWKARLAGATVTVVDPTPGHGASWAAAGMLAAVTEAHFGEEGLLQLNLRSAAAWPRFKDELEAVDGHDLAYRDDGTLAVAFDTGDREALAHLHAFHRELNLDSTWLTGSQCRDMEPLLAPAISGGLYVKSDYHVDPRRMVAALVGACGDSGVEMVGSEFHEVKVLNGIVTGAQLEDGEVIAARQTLLATGWQAAKTPGLPPEACPPVRPVKGQILRLKMPDGWPLPHHTIRGISQGQPIYVVVRPDGEIVCGATAEELGADTRVTGGGIYTLLRGAQLVFPTLLEAEFKEAFAGLRPGSPDNAPMIGHGGLPGLLVAAGHFRNGILLTPITADLISGLLVGSDGVAPELPAWATGFDPRRFSDKPR